MIQIIPAIDIIEGRCVRLSQGDYACQTTYDASPLDMVKRYADCGVTRVHVVDLDGAKASEPLNLKTLEALASLDGPAIEWGGGIKSEASLKSARNAGAAHIVVGSAAARKPELFAEWLGRYGADLLVLGADVRDGKISVNGWKEDLDVTIDDLTDRFLPLGLSQVICTEISCDGMLQGPATELYTRLQAKYPAIDFTVSGGISSMADIERLDHLGLRRVIVGKAIYENKISLQAIAEFIVRGA